MGISLSEFKSKVQDVARPNRFLLTFASPAGGVDAETVSYLVKGSQVPGRTIGEVLLYWQGMQNKLAGDPTFEDFVCTFLNDYEYRARTTIEDWMALTDNQVTNVRTAQDQYKADAVIQQLGREGEVIASWKMIGFWPKILDPIDLNTETVDTPSEFGCTFSYDYFERI